MNKIKVYKNMKLADLKRLRSLLRAANIDIECTIEMLDQMIAEKENG